MEDEQFLVVLPPVPYQRYALTTARKHQLVEELRRLRAKWVPKVTVQESEVDHQVLTVSASISKVALLCARSPMDMLYSIANDVVCKMQQAIGEVQANRHVGGITPLDMHEVATRWPWDGG